MSMHWHPGSNATRMVNNKNMQQAEVVIGHLCFKRNATIQIINSILVNVCLTKIFEK